MHQIPKAIEKCRPLRCLERLHSACGQVVLHRVKRKLREIYRTLDPVALLAQMREAQNELGERVDQRAGTPGMTVRPLHSDLVTFVRELGDNWNRGEQRIIHRRRYVRRKPVPRRPSMLDPYGSLIEEWLTAAPHLSAIEILSRLKGHASDRFGNSQRRTVQRLVRNWRLNAGRQLISSAEVTLTTDPGSRVPMQTRELA
jgi:hypothetical protein